MIIINEQSFLSLNATDCTLDNCRTCEGTPPVCRQCADGYTINSVDTTLCGRLCMHDCCVAIHKLKG